MDALQPSFWIDGDTHAVGTPALTAALARSHGTLPRPRCMCTRAGVEMYIAAHGNGFVLKRMPNTGSSHATDCTSYEAPADLTGLGQVLGTAIREDPSTGQTRLRLDFSLHKMPGRTGAAAATTPSDRARSDGARLSLKAFLHYLWDQSGLTRWHPGFRNRRSWSTVRRLLSTAAEGKVTGGSALSEMLFIPEPFSAEHKETIRARRLRRWAAAARQEPHARRPLILLIAELKEIAPARYGFKLVVKHLPDQPLSVDQALMRRIAKVYGPLLELWSIADDVRLVTVVTLDLGDSGVPSAVELGMMAVTDQWIPIEDAEEAELVSRLVQEERSFIKALRYNLSPTQPMACAILTDTECPPEPLHIAGSAARDLEAGSPTDRAWTWFRDDGEMPALPASRKARSEDVAQLHARGTELVPASRQIAAHATWT